MTRTATVTFSFIASIILFLGALLLTPQTGSAQESPECEGEQQTIITATGMKITTCNWDLDDAPINKEAAGLETTLAPSAPSGCLCNYAKIKPKRWNKFPDIRECWFDGNLTLALNGRVQTQQGPKFMSFVAFPHAAARRCNITIRNKTVSLSGMTQTEADACVNDVLAYDIANDIAMGQGKGGVPYCVVDPRCDKTRFDNCDPPVVPSDARLKTDIVRIGTTAHDLPLYRFRYIGSDAVYEGVMAQDVLMHDPGAVVIGDDGFMAVYYGRLGIELKRVQ